MPYFPFSLQNGLLPPPLLSPPDRRDLVDPVSGVIQGARFINLQTGDYEVNATGHFVGMNDIQQKVQLALLTTFGTATSPIGNTFSQILLITPNLTQQIQAAVNAALANMLNAGQITFTQPLSIVQLPMGRVNLTIYWMDLTTKQNQQTNITLGKSI